MNLLHNGGFEGDWTRETHSGQEYGEIFVPEGWVAFWKEGLPVHHDPYNQVGYSRPEMHVINFEAPYLDPPRILEGNRALKLFTFCRIHQAGIYQSVDLGDLPEGKTLADYHLKLSGYAHAWSSLDDNPFTSNIDLQGVLNFTFQLGIDPAGMTDPWSDQIIWGDGAHLYDAYAELPAVTIAPVFKTVTVFVRSTVLWPFKHCDAYFDEIVLELIPNAPDPDPDPDPDPSELDIPEVLYLTEEGSKLYPHGVGEGGVFDSLEYMLSQGEPLKFVKVVCPGIHDLEAIRNLHELSPETKFICRLMRGPDPSINVEGPDFSGSAYLYMDNLLPLMEKYRDCIDYWELWNEQDPVGEEGHLQMARFALSCMEYARQKDFHLAVMSYSSGVPENYEWQRIWDDSAFFQTAKIGGHILSVHAYCRSAYPEEFKSHLLRYTWLYENILIPNNCVVPLIFTEYNIPELDDSGIWHHPEFPTLQSLLDEYHQADEALADLWYCLGATLYTYGAGEADYNLDDVWEEICDLELSVKDRQNAMVPGLGPDPDPDPDKYPRTVVMADPTYMNQAQLDAAYKFGREQLFTTTPSWNDAVPFEDERPREWLTNTIYAGPVPVDQVEIYQQWIDYRDPSTIVFFDAPEPRFSQCDPLWAAVRLGVSSETMCSAGCLVTAVAAWMTQIDPYMTPLKLVNWLNEHGGFLSDGRLLLTKPTEMPLDSTQRMQLSGYYKWDGEPADLELIREVLELGPTILMVDYKPDTPELETHFVVALQMIDDEDVLIMDTRDGKIKMLMPLYGLGSLEVSIARLLDYRVLDTGGEEPTDPDPDPDPAPLVLPLIGFNDPLNSGAYDWLRALNGESLVVVPVFLDDESGNGLTLSFPDTKVRTIVNLRYSWATGPGQGGRGTLPGTIAAQEIFIEAAVSTILGSTGVWGWTLCNEPNNPREWPLDGFQRIGPVMLADVYNDIRDRVPEDVRMSLGALDPFNAVAGDPRDWIADMYGNVHFIDFIAAHGYLRGPDASLVYSNAKFTDDPLRWQYLNAIGCVTELLKSIPERFQSRPVYITEANHLWKTSEAVGDWGWVFDRRATNVIAALMGAATAAGNIAGIALYRWSGDAWQVSDNPTVLGTVRQLIEEV